MKRVITIALLFIALILCYRVGYNSAIEDARPLEVNDSSALIQYGSEVHEYRF